MEKKRVSGIKIRINETNNNYQMFTKDILVLLPFVFFFGPHTDLTQLMFEHHGGDQPVAALIKVSRVNMCS